MSEEKDSEISWFTVFVIGSIVILHTLLSVERARRTAVDQAQEAMIFRLKSEIFDLRAKQRASVSP